MIVVTRMDRQVMHLNPDHIISIEETPDTVIALFNGHRFIVKESAEIIINRIVAFRAKIVRRSGRSSGKKYLDRQKTGRFLSSTLNRDIVYPDNSSDHERSPLHSRDN